MERLDCVIQNYAWGDCDSIASLTGRASSGEPEAELWMGAHPMAPSVLSEAGVSLAQAIERAPIEMLGSSVAAQYGQLPFLSKVLAVGRPLSIQAHPTATQAQLGFDREERAGLDKLDPTRTYRDPNHKPELISALTRFEAKSGFRDPAVTAELMARVGGGKLDELRTGLVSSPTPATALRSSLEWLLRADQPDVGGMIDALRSPNPASIPEFEDDLAWVREMYGHYGYDIGIVVAVLMNHVTLDPGEAMFLGPGNLHAYLSGTGVEVMANSDNVIRGGLTRKHVDTAELISILNFEPVVPEIQVPSGPAHTFDVPVPEFSLTRIQHASELVLDRSGPEILLVTEGQFILTGRSGSLTVGKGQVVFVTARDGSHTLSGSGLAWLTTVGI